MVLAIPDLRDLQRMDGLAGEPGKIVMVPGWELIGGLIIQVSVSALVYPGKRGLKFLLIGDKIICSDLLIKSSQRLLDHIPTVDPIIGGLESLAIDGNLIN